MPMQGLKLGQVGRHRAGQGHAGETRGTEAQVVFSHTGVVWHSERPGVGLSLRPGVGCLCVAEIQGSQGIGTEARSLQEYELLKGPLEQTH